MTISTINSVTVLICDQPGNHLKILRHFPWVPSDTTYDLSYAIYLRFEQYHEQQRGRYCEHFPFIFLSFWRLHIFASNLKFVTLYNFNVIFVDNCPSHISMPCQFLFLFFFFKTFWPKISTLSYQFWSFLALIQPFYATAIQLPTSSLLWRADNINVTHMSTLTVGHVFRAELRLWYWATVYC